MFKITGTKSIIAILTIANLFNYIDRFLLAGLLSPIQQEFHLSDKQAGILISMFIIVYSLASPIFGFLGDRFKRIPILVGAVAIWSLACGFTGLVTSFGALLICRSVIGIGEAAYGSMGPSLIDERVPAERKSRTLGIFFVAIFVGAALGYILAGLLEPGLGWRKTFMAVGFPGLIVALLISFIDDGKKVEKKKQKISGKEFWNVQKTLLKNHLYLFTVLGYAAWTFVVPGMSAWAPTFMERELSLDRAHGNQVFGLITVVTGILGTVVGSIWSDRWTKTSARGPLLVCAISTIPAIVALYFAIRANSSTDFFVLVGITLFFLSMSNAPVNVMILNSVPFELRTSAMALSILLIHWLGDVISPPFIGWLSDMHGIRDAFLTLPLGLFACVFFWWMGSRKVIKIA